MENKPGIDIEKINFDENGEVQILDEALLDEVDAGRLSELADNEGGGCNTNCSC